MPRQVFPNSKTIGPSYQDAVPKGLIEPGNIDLYDRPTVGQSTVRSLSFEDDGKEVLVPTVIGNRVVSDDEAIDEYFRTGKHLGIFTNPKTATQYAERLHQDYESRRIPPIPARQRFQFGGPVQSPFLAAVARPREKGFAEQVLDDLANISGKQALALPLTLPLHAGAGALEGLSFGLLSPTDELEQMLGQYAPPAPLQSAAEIAGTIGGSFVPYIGASRVASGIFQGIVLGAKLARGAFTFGAPEVVRQALAQELDPAHAGRALATGAAFSLPLPRPLLAPAVAATELMFGASPLEAGVSAGFAALFGPMGDETKKAILPEPPRPVRGLLGPGRTLVPPAPSAPKSQVDLILETAGKADLPEARVSLQQLAQNVKALADQPEEALSNALLKAIDTLGPDAPQTKGLQYALAQKRQGFVPAKALVTNPLKPPVMGIETITPGPTNPFEMRATHEEMLANLRSNGGAIGHTKAAQLEELLHEARQEASALKGRGQAITPQRVAEIQARQEAIMAAPEVKFANDAEALRSATTELGKTMRDADVEAFMSKLPLHYQREPAFLEQLRTIAEDRRRVLDKYVKPLQALPAKTPELSRLETLANNYGVSTELVEGKLHLRRGQATRTFDNVKAAEEWVQSLETGMSPATLAAPDASAIRRLQLDFGGKNFRLTDDVGSTMDVVLPGGEVKIGNKIQIVPEGHLYTRNINIAKPVRGQGVGSMFARARGELMREFGLTKTLGKVTSDKPGAVFRMREISEEIARGDVVRSIDDLRAIAHSRGMVVDFDGKALNITNQMTGETIRGLDSLKEAAEAVRSAPNVAVAAREIGPQVPGAPPLPGAGSLHGLGTEQPPPFCPLVST